MAAKKIITILALLFTLSLQLTAEDKPKKSKFHTVTHWVGTHKKVLAISAGAAAASSFTAWKLTRPQTPFVNNGPAVPCPSSACITVGK